MGTSLEDMKERQQNNFFNDLFRAFTMTEVKNKTSDLKDEEKPKVEKFNIKECVKKALKTNASSGEIIPEKKFKESLKKKNMTLLLDKLESSNKDDNRAGISERLLQKNFFEMFKMSNALSETNNLQADVGNQKPTGSIKTFQNSTCFNINNEGHVVCSLCETSETEGYSFENFIAHCKTKNHKLNLKQRFSDKNLQEEDTKTREQPREKKQYKVSPINFRKNVPKESSSPKQSIIPQNKGLNCPKPEKLVESNKKKTRNIQSNNKNETQIFNEFDVDELLKEIFSEGQSQKPKVKSEPVKKKSQVPEPKNKPEKNDEKLSLSENNILMLNSFCIKIDPQSSFSCNVCDKKIPKAANLFNLLKNVSYHIHSEKHNNKLLKVEDFQDIQV